MSNQSRVCLYIILIMINSFLGFLASYSLGLFRGYSKQIDEYVKCFDSSIDNRSLVFKSIKSDCSLISINYTGFDMQPHSAIRSAYELSVKLANWTIILSTTYNIYLCHILLFTRLVCSLIIGILSSFFFVIVYSYDERIRHLFGVFLVFIGFILIVSHVVLVTSNDQLESPRRKTDLEINLDEEENNKNDVDYHARGREYEHQD